MRKHYVVLKTAIEQLEKNGVEQRQTVYLNARNALIRELRATSPPLAPADIARRRLKLEQAIREIERQSAASAAPVQAAAGSEEESITKDTTTSSVLEMASTPVEIEPGPEDVFRRAIVAAKNCGRVDTLVAVTAPKDEAVRLQLDEDSSPTARPEQLRVDHEDVVRPQPLLVPSASDLTATIVDQLEPRMPPARSEQDYADVVDLSPLKRKARGQTLLLGVLIIALALGAVALAWSQRATIGQIITTGHGKNAAGS